MDVRLGMNLSLFKFIFIGDTHGFINDFEKQKEIIEKVNPEFVLSEYMQDIVLDSHEKFNEILKNKNISEMVDFSEIEDLILLCYQKNIKLIGIDLKNFGFDEHLQKVFKSFWEINKSDERRIKEIVKRREFLHLEKINFYKNKTDKSIIIILGTWYLRVNSLLMKNLDNYITFLPCDKERNILLKPIKNKSDITYCTKIKNVEKNKT